MHINISTLTKFLVLLSIVGGSLNSPTIASTVTPQNSKNPANSLIAQQSTCTVVNIQTGQLALRFSPNGRSRAGLNNGNTVVLLRNGSGVWSYVRVLNGPNSSVNGLEGWVNSNYLSCSDSSSTPEVYCNVVNIRSGQLALRFTPNGKSKAGLNNGNVVGIISNGSELWTYVRVIEGPNRSVNGLEGWVNSNYLSCMD